MQHTFLNSIALIRYNANVNAALLTTQSSTKTLKPDRYLCCITASMHSDCDIVTDQLSQRCDIIILTYQFDRVLIRHQEGWWGRRGEDPANPLIVGQHSTPMYCAFTTLHIPATAIEIRFLLCILRAASK